MPVPRPAAAAVPSLSAASEAGCPAHGAGPGIPQPLRGPGGGHQRLAGGPGLGDEVVGGPAERFRRVEQRRVRGEQDDPAVPARGWPAAPHRPRPGAAPGPGPGPAGAGPRRSGRGGPRVRARRRREACAARTAPASSSTVATPPKSASACRAVSATLSSRSRQLAWAAHPSCRAPTCWATRARVTAEHRAQFVLARERIESGVESEQQAGQPRAGTRPGQFRRGPAAARPR